MLRGLECPRAVQTMMLMRHERNTRSQVVYSIVGLDQRRTGGHGVDDLHRGGIRVCGGACALDPLLARSRPSLRLHRDVRSAIEGGLRMEYRDMCRWSMRAYASQWVLEPKNFTVTLEKEPTLVCDS